MGAPNPRPARRQTLGCRGRGRWWRLGYDSSGEPCAALRAANRAASATTTVCAADAAAAATLAAPATRTARATVATAAAAAHVATAAAAAHTHTAQRATRAATRAAAAVFAVAAAARLVRGAVVNGFVCLHYASSHVQCARRPTRTLALLDTHRPRLPLRPAKLGSPRAHAARSGRRCCRQQRWRWQPAAVPCPGDAGAAAASPIWLGRLQPSATVLCHAGALLRNERSHAPR